MALLSPACFSPSGSETGPGSGTSSGPDTTTTTTTTTSTASTSTTTSTTTLEPTTSPLTGTTTDPGPTSTDSGPTTTDVATTEPATASSTGPETSTTSTTTGDSMTAPPPPTCGDGVVEDFEQCDDGNTIETDDCVSCINAFCGDGIVRAGVEECDEDGDNCENCARVYMRVFVSSATMASKLGGLAGADKECQALADDADLKGTFKAWLSTGDVDAASRLHHADRPYKRIDGAPLAEHWDDFVDGTHLNPLNITEQGDEVGPGSECGVCPVWTATTPMGIGLDDDCNAWSALLLDTVVVGECSVKDARWTQGCAQRKCNLFARLYCVEQGL
ncbi:DUF4215 domain-containing protein [Nannocystis pusilla]|uniref:DUF4215 domain-containing protein n=1 Tax=Nannocystis pusilla TaxID=889268 RepID=UPI003BF1F63B